MTWAASVPNLEPNDDQRDFWINFISSLSRRTGERRRWMIRWLNLWADLRFLKRRNKDNFLCRAISWCSSIAQSSIRRFEIHLIFMIIWPRRFMKLQLSFNESEQRHSMFNSIIWRFMAMRTWSSFCPRTIGFLFCFRDCNKRLLKQCRAVAHSKKQGMLWLSEAGNFSADSIAISCAASYRIDKLSIKGNSIRIL